MTQSKKKTIKKKVAPAYTVAIKLGDKTLLGEGTTLYEALAAVPKPIKVMGKMFVTVTHGEKSRETMYMPARGKRLFYPQAQYLMAKYLELGL